METFARETKMKMKMIQCFRCSSKFRIETNLSEKGKFPERSTTFCNVVEVSNFVVKLLFVFLNVIGPLTKKVNIHCSQLTL